MRSLVGGSASRRVGVGFACAGLMMACGSALYGQAGSAGPSGHETGSAQVEKRDFRFEVASIRPAEAPNGREYGNGPIPPAFTPGRYRELKVPLAVLAMTAFRTHHGFEIEYPQWMASAYFTIDARVPEGATKADVPIMMQHLLEERFGLVYHHEARQMKGYELVVGKSGARLAESARPVPDRSTAAWSQLGPSIEFKDGMPQFTKDGSGELWHGSSVEWRGRDERIDRVAARLADKLDAPVMDATGLDRKYDYTVLYTAEPTAYSGNAVSPLPLSSGSGSPAGADGAPVPLAHPLLRDALREQLGLELRQVKNVPVDVVVIDSATKEPTEN